MRDDPYPFSRKFGKLLFRGMQWLEPFTPGEFSVSPIFTVGAQ